MPPPGGRNNFVFCPSLLMRIEALLDFHVVIGNRHVWRALDCDDFRNDWPANVLLTPCDKPIRDTIRKPSPTTKNVALTSARLSEAKKGRGQRVRRIIEGQRHALGCPYVRRVQDGNRPRRTPQKICAPQKRRHAAENCSAAIRAESPA